MMSDKLIAEYVARDVYEGIKSMKKELKEDIKRELQVEQHELEFLRDMYKGITLGRVIDAWRCSKVAKKWSNEVSSKMGSNPQDIVQRVNVLFQRLDKAKIEGDVEVEGIVEDELKFIKEFINKEADDVGGLSGDGFLKVIRAYLSTYGFVHKELKEDELLHICKIAKEGTFNLVEGDKWISTFANDILAKCI